MRQSQHTEHAFRVSQESIGLIEQAFDEAEAELPEAEEDGMGKARHDAGPLLSYAKMGLAGLMANYIRLFTNSTGNMVRAAVSSTERPCDKNRFATLSMLSATSTMYAS